MGESKEHGPRDDALDDRVGPGCQQPNEDGPPSDPEQRVLHGVGVSGGEGKPALEGSPSSGAAPPLPPSGVLGEQLAAFLTGRLSNRYSTIASRLEGIKNLQLGEANAVVVQSLLDLDAAVADLRQRLEVVEQLVQELGHGLAALEARVKVAEPESVPSDQPGDEFSQPSRPLSSER